MEMDYPWLYHALLNNVQHTDTVDASLAGRTAAGHGEVHLSTPDEVRHASSHGLDRAQPRSMGRGRLDAGFILGGRYRKQAASQRHFLS